MDMRELVKNDMENQNKLLDYYKKELHKIPKGSLYLKTNGKKEYYYIDQTTNKRKYINKKKGYLVDCLKKRRYMEVSIKIMESNLEVEKKFLAKYKPYDYTKIVEGLPKAYSFKVEEKIRKQQIKHYTNEILHETTKGLKVRSKSEAIICEMLYANNLDFEYEKKIKLKKNLTDVVIFRPDFSFVNSATKEWFHWEHLGMISDNNYRMSNIDKLMIYMENGIIPGANLFITADSMNGQLDIRSIMRTIEIIKGIV